MSYWMRRPTGLTELVSYRTNFSTTPRGVRGPAHRAAGIEVGTPGTGFGYGRFAVMLGLMEALGVPNYGCTAWVRVAPGAVRDLQGWAYPGLTARFLVADTAPPLLLEQVPAPNTGDSNHSKALISVNVTLRFAFNEAVYAGQGAITIRTPGEPGVLVRRIPANDTTVVNIQGGDVKINPKLTLAFYRRYVISVERTAFHDAQGNAYAGTYFPVRTQKKVRAETLPIAPLPLPRLGR
jgi:hypothetical protein